MIKKMLLKIPLVRKYKELADGKFDELVNNLYIKGDYQNAFIYARTWMEGNCNGTPNYSLLRWWSMMQQAIKSGVKLQEGKNAYDDLVRIVESDCSIAEERLAAECLINLAMWGYNFDDLKKCIELTQRGLKADSSWGEPSFLLGWFHLSFDEEASVSYFNNAIALNPEYLKRIEEDSNCINHPNIIKSIKEQQINAVGFD